MKKLASILIVFIFATFLLCGCVSSLADTAPAGSDSSTVSDISSDETSSETIDKGSDVETSSDPVKISEERAIEIAEAHWGIKSGDKDEATGFPFLIMPCESGNENIRIDLKWLVNGSTYSTVDFVLIDPVSGEIISQED